MYRVPGQKIVAEDTGGDEKQRYRARVSGIGLMEFQASDRLLLTEPHKLIFVHPWIRDLRGPHDESRSNSEAEAHPPLVALLLEAVLAATMDDCTRALQLIVRLQQPFRAVLLQQQPHGEYRRVAAKHEIVVPGLERRISSAKEVRTEIVEIL